MKTADLQGAALDYYVAEVEGMLRMAGGTVEDKLGGYSPSTKWAHGGLLIDKYELTLMRWKYDPEYRQADETDFWAVEGKCVSHYLDVYRSDYEASPSVDRGDTPLQAICRAVVRATFGDEVEEVLP